MVFQAPFLQCSLTTRWEMGASGEATGYHAALYPFLPHGVGDASDGGKSQCLDEQYLYKIYKVDLL